MDIVATEKRCSGYEIESGVRYRSLFAKIIIAVEAIRIMKLGRFFF